MLVLDTALPGGGAYGGTMKSKLVLWAASCLLCAILPAQWLEKVVPLPDSFSGMTNPLAFVVNTGNNTVYVGGGSGSSCLVVLDGVTHRKIARIPVPGHDHRLCYDPVQNKVYCISRYSPCVYVIDAAANALADSIDLGGELWDVCYAPGVNKVYCAGSQTVTAIDCSADTITGRAILWGNSPFMLCAAPEENKVYCGLHSPDDDNIVVIDCAGDSILHTVHIIDVGISDIAYNPTANKLYVAWGSFGSLIVIDCASDTVLSWTNVGEGHGRLAVNAAADKVYVSCSTVGRVDVISGVTDQVVASIDSLENPDWIVMDTIDGAVFCAVSAQDLVAIDCAADTILGQVPIGPYVQGVCWSPDNDCVYVGAGNVFVVDASARQVVSQVPVSWFDVRQVCWCAQDSELYACSGESIAVVELHANRVQKFVPLLTGIECVHYYAPGNKVYCAGGGRVTVLDCTTDSVIKSIPVSADAYAFCYDGVDRKLYLQHSRDHLTVISCDQDSVVAELSFGDYFIDELAYSPTMNRLYCALEDSTVAVIDCAGDTVIDELPVTRDSHWLCYIPDGDLLACANYWDDSVQVASCATGQILGSVGVFNSPGPMAFSGRSHRLYSVSASPRRVAVISVPALNLVGSIALQDGVAVVDYDSLADKVVCAGGSTVEFIACGSDSLVAAIQVQGSPGSMTRGAERRLYVANQGASSFSIIRDTTTVGIAETMNDERGTMNVEPTLVRGVLFFEARGEKRETRGELLDISGRKVLDLKPGPNDVRSLAPGVYFVREAQAQAVRKVVIAK